MKYAQIHIDILTNENYHNLENIHTETDVCHVFLSKLNLERMSRNDLLSIKTNIDGKGIILIPSVNNYLIVKSWKKYPELTLIMDWFLRLPTSVSLVMKNGALLFPSNSNAEWNDIYDGERGYGVNAHDGVEPLVYHKHSASINNRIKEFSFATFDGFYLKKANNKT